MSSTDDNWPGNRFRTDKKRYFFTQHEIDLYSKPYTDVLENTTHYYNVW